MNTLTEIVKLSVQDQTKKVQVFNLRNKGKPNSTYLTIKNLFKIGIPKWP
jgi:hypothetical protein